MTGAGPLPPPTRRGIPAAIILFLLIAAHGDLRAQAYFQQRVDHRIAVRLDDERHVLHAFEEFDYTNNAPQALDTLWIHLWPNAYSSRNTALCEQLDAQNEPALHFATPEERGRIDSLAFTQEGEPLAWGFHPQHTDIGWIALPTPLVSGARITIATPFRVTLPSAAFSRLGHEDQAYYITQWFPKPAVFDAQGWHAMPYLTQGEFFSEFGSYEVAITLPANYVVGATGALQDAAENTWMDSLAALPPSFVLSAGRDRTRFPPSDRRTKTIHFRQDDVHDFAWFADKRFQVRKGEVALERSGRSVTTWALVTPRNAALWKDGITYLNESVRLFSRWVGDYPYASCAAVDGNTAAGGGMEYPMITLINDEAAPFDLDVVIAHEVGHNWFYGMLASDERAHPWMDEGINSFYEQRYVETRYGREPRMQLAGIPVGGLTRGKGITYRRHNELQYLYNARRNWDAPTVGHSTSFTFMDYGTTVYSKTALVFDHVRSALGDSLFDAGMQAYFQAWHHRHPAPGDLRSALENTTRTDLTWAFEELIGTADKVDVKAERLREGMLKYREQAERPFPFPVTAWSAEDSLGTLWHRARRTHAADTARLPWNVTQRARIDALSRTLDIDRRNNGTGTLLPEVKFLAGLEREDRRSLYYAPAIAHNSHDGWMLGAALYNTVYPAQRFEWAAAPLYGVDSKRLAGGARFQWHHDRLRSPWLRNVHVGVSGFAASLWKAEDVDQWYQRLVPSIQLDPRLPATAPMAYLRYRSILLWHHAQGTALDAQDQEVPVDATSEDVFHEVQASLTRANGLHPYELDLTALHHQAFTRLALDAKWSAIYDRHAHRATFRLFTGSFLRKDAALMRPEMGWRMYWGSSDLLYDHLFTDRQYVGQNTAQQMTKDQGGFKTPTAVGTSDTWIAALNMELDFPFTLPLSAFFSYGAAPFTTITQNGRSTDWKGYWETGIGLRIWRDLVEVWVPLGFSKEDQEEQELRDLDFTERIRFVFALERMDPTQAVRRLPH